MEEILESIKKLRKTRGLSQKQIAERLEISQNNYSLLERGQIALTVDKLYRIAEILEVKIGYFFCDADASTSKEVVRQLEKNIINLKIRILELRSYVNNAAIEGDAPIHIKFQENIGTWNIAWGNLKEPLSKETYNYNVKEIGDEILKLYKELERLT